MNIFSKTGKSVMSLEEVSKKLAGLRLPTSMVFTPINLKQEREKFFDSDTYEPQFEYGKIKNKNSEILKNLASLKSISDVDPRISDFYIQLIESKEESNRLMDAVGNNELVSEISYHRYGKPSALLFRNASRVLRNRLKPYDIAKYPPIKDRKMLGYSDVERVFNLTFKMLGLENWGVQESKNIPKNVAKVGIKSKKVFLSPDIKRSEFKLRKTLVHEVGTHVLRTINGEASGFEALSKANLPSYLDVEEGLATWNEEYMGLLTKKWLKDKASMSWAIYIGEKMTFRQLYNSMLGVLPTKSAFDTTFRVKRGLGDTSYPGIYTKDIVYFRGFRRVKKKLEKDKSMYEKLYAGKIDFKQSRWVDEGLIPKAEIIPTKEKWKEIFKEVGI
jgi:hypothetical protein